MRACALALFVSAMVLQQGTPDLQACGDKFLLVGRGAKFRQAYAAVYPASILVFASPQRSAAKAIRDPRLQTDLKTAGHASRWCKTSGPWRERSSPIASISC